MTNTEFKKEKNKITAGFTIVELIVVLAVFATIMTAATSIFISIIQQQKNISNEQEILNQASYAIEYMSRSIRTAVTDESGSCLGAPFQGYIYLLTKYDSVSGTYKGVKFISNNNDCHEFFLDTADGILKEIKNSSQAQNILSSSLLNASFVVNGDKSLQGAIQGNLTQPRLTILLHVLVEGVQSQKEKVIQMTVSQRNLNI